MTVSKWRQYGTRSSQLTGSRRDVPIQLKLFDLEGNVKYLKIIRSSRIF
jgi:hypothetical protein